jgi:flagellar biosynthesis protein FliR
MLFAAVTYGRLGLSGELSAFPAVFGAMLLAAIGENWSVVSIPVLLACLFLHPLLRAPEIPSRVRVRTALLVTVALLILLVNVGVLSWQYRQGAFNGLFL